MGTPPRIDLDGRITFECIEEPLEKLKAPPPLPSCPIPIFLFQSTSLSQEDLTVTEARAHVLAPSEKVPGDFSTLDGWSVSLVGNEVRGGGWERSEKGSGKGARGGQMGSEDRRRGGGKRNEAERRGTR